MFIQRCSSLSCSRSFQVNEFEAETIGFGAMEQINCPHCGIVYAGKDGSVYVTHALSDDEEAVIGGKNMPNHDEQGGGLETLQT